MNEILYERLKLIAEEAHEQGMTKLAEAIEESLPQEKKTAYSYEELHDDIHKDLWKVATKLMVYYDLKSVQPENLDKSLISWASRLIDDIEKTLDVNTLKSPLDEKVAGEDEPMYDMKKHWEDVRDLGVAEELLKKKCKICGHHEDEHVGTVGIEEHCTHLVGGGYRTAPKQCDCVGFNIGI